jgi:hypothetical protein
LRTRRGAENQGGDTDLAVVDSGGTAAKQQIGINWLQDSHNYKTLGLEATFRNNSQIASQI